MDTIHVTPAEKSLLFRLVERQRNETLQALGDNAISREIVSLTFDNLADKLQSDVPANETIINDIDTGNNGSDNTDNDVASGTEVINNTEGTHEPAVVGVAIENIPVTVSNTNGEVPNGLDGNNRIPVEKSDWDNFAPSPTVEREIFRLRIVHEYSSQEIAAKIGEATPKQIHGFLIRRSRLTHLIRSFYEINGNFSTSYVDATKEMEEARKSRLPRYKQSASQYASA